MSKSLPAINVQMPNMPESTMQTAMNGVFLLAAAGGSYLLIKKLLADAQRNKALEDLSNPTSKDGMAATLASQLYSGMITNEFLNDTIGDGTNLTVVFDAAKKIFANRAILGFDDVARKYKALYQRDLLSDLEGDLNASEKAKFMSIISTGLGALGLLPQVKYIQTTAAAYVLNQQLKPLQAVPAGLKLGTHLESLVTANNKVYHGFMYNGQMRYINGAFAKINTHVSA